ncbi:MAG: hypothetical protein HQK63_01380 [Desulfamplus sp.]|nr:hypothetical protein [Desulfamplus sp.]
MTKPIKFNLILDGKPIRDITGLEENFNIDDLLEHYKSGVLHRWLKIRQHSDLAAKVEAITEKDELTIAESLVNIFGISLSKQEIGDAVYPMIFRCTKENQLKEYEKNFENERAIIKNYHEDYRSLCEGLKKSKTDYSFVKHSLKKMESEFYGLYEMNYYALFSDLIKESPLSVFGVLANQTLRSLFLFHSKIQTNIKNYVNSIFKVNNACENEISVDDIRRKIPDLIEEFRINQDIEGVPCFFTKYGSPLSELIDFKGSDSIVIIRANPKTVEGINLAGLIIKNDDDMLIRMISQRTVYNFDYAKIDDIKKFIAKERKGITQKTAKPPIPKDLPPYIKAFSGHTESYWKDIESAGKQYMIIYMQEGNFVRNMGKKGEEFSADDVNGNFPILNGIDYKSNNDSHTLYYMEV